MDNEETTISNVNLYTYDRASQLTNEVVSTNGLSSGVTNGWEYDEAGNWLLSSGDTKRRGYNEDNEFVGFSTNKVDVIGEVYPGTNNNKWYNTWATCRGVSVQVSTNNGTFTLPGVPVGPWQNSLLVTVQRVRPRIMTFYEKGQA